MLSLFGKLSLLICSLSLSSCAHKPATKKLRSSDKRPLAIAKSNTKSAQVSPEIEAEFTFLEEYRLHQKKLAVFNTSVRNLTFNSLLPRAVDIDRDHPTSSLSRIFTFVANPIFNGDAGTLDRESVANSQSENQQKALQSLQAKPTDMNRELGRELASELAHVKEKPSAIVAQSTQPLTPNPAPQLEEVESYPELTAQQLEPRVSAPLTTSTNIKNGKSQEDPEVIRLQPTKFTQASGKVSKLPSALKVQPPLGLASLTPEKSVRQQLKRLNQLENKTVEFSDSTETPLIFDIPVTYNQAVQHWVQYFQGVGKNSFRRWMERSGRFMPSIQFALDQAGLPMDLGYVAMIESGFNPNAISHAGAVGLWQFISSTGKQYGMRSEWWLDERRDFYKSTLAAIDYMKELYSQFGSWYLVAASYNMGESRVRRPMTKFKTNDFWVLADMGALSEETRNYVPKIIAAMLIAKAPGLYGFRDLNYQTPTRFEYFHVPGGTDLMNLASYLGVSAKYLRELNPELLKGYIPNSVTGHRIRIPKGSTITVAQYFREQGSTSRN